MRALTSLWTPNSRLYDRADEGAPRRRVLDATIGAQNYRDAGVWKPIDLTPQPSDLPGYDWMVPGLPYKPYLSLTGARRVYPDRADPGRYIDLPAGRFMSGRTFTRVGNSLVWESSRFDVVLRWQNGRLKLDVVVKRSIPFDSIEFDIDRVGIDEATLLSMMTGLKAIDSSPLPIERPLSVSLVGGVLTWGFDLTGMTFPVTIDPTLDLSVGASADDTQARRLTTTAFASNTTTLEFGAKGTNSGYGLSLRWTGVNIPAGATIDVAYITYIAATTLSDDTVNSDICAENASNPAAPTTYNDHINRTRTASVAYDGVAAQTAGASIQTPSIVAPIQTVVTDQGGTGSALQMFIEDKDLESSAGANRAIAAWDHATYAPPAIHIEHREATPGGSVVILMAGMGLI